MRKLFLANNRPPGNTSASADVSFRLTVVAKGLAPWLIPLSQAGLYVVEGSVG